MSFDNSESIKKYAYVAGFVAGYALASYITISMLENKTHKNIRGVAISVACGGFVLLSSIVLMCRVLYVNGVCDRQVGKITDLWHASPHTVAQDSET